MQKLLKGSEKKFRVSKDSTVLHELQKQIIQTQNESCQIVEKQFRVFRESIHYISRCELLLYSRQQVTFIFDTFSTTFAVLQQRQSLPSRFICSQMKLKTAFPSLPSKYVCMSIFPQKLSKKNLKMVNKVEGIRPAIAILNHDFLAFYETRLLLEISTLKDCPLMKMALLSAFRQTIFTVYRGLFLLLLQMDEVLAQKRVKEQRIWQFRKN